MRRAGRRGFTIIELIVVMLVIGILASMMVLRYIDLKAKAIASRATSDMDTVRMAAISRYYETGQWPAAAGPGVVPADLVPYLGAGFRFTDPSYTLEFENFAPPGGGPSPTYQIAIRFSTSDPKVRASMIQTVGQRAPYVVLGNDVAVIVVGPDGHT